MTAHILIVEDDRVTRMRLAGYLRSLGYRITEVEDAEDMQAVIDTDPPEDLRTDERFMRILNDAFHVTPRRRRPQPVA